MPENKSNVPARRVGAAIAVGAGGAKQRTSGDAKLILANYAEQRIKAITDNAVRAKKTVKLMLSDIDVAIANSCGGLGKAFFKNKPLHKNMLRIGNVERIMKSADSLKDVLSPLVAKDAATELATFIEFEIEAISEAAIKYAKHDKNRKTVKDRDVELAISMIKSEKAF
jgi:histone H3/H4